MSSGPATFQPSNGVEKCMTSLAWYHYQTVISDEIGYTSCSHWPCLVPVAAVLTSYQIGIHRNSSVGSVLRPHLEEIAWYSSTPDQAIEPHQKAVWDHPAEQISSTTNYRHFDIPVEKAFRWNRNQVFRSKSPLPLPKCYLCGLLIA